MGSQLDPLSLFRVGSRERAAKSQFPQLDFVKPSSGFHPVTWDRIRISLGSVKVHPLIFFCTPVSIKCDSWAQSWLTPLQIITLVVSPRLGLR